MSVAEQVIYDFGMNNGDDIEYYLLKSRRVVGVEANARLCDEVRARFPEEIEDGRLTILNVALSDVESSEPLTFYIHKNNHVLSQLPRPTHDDIDRFEAVQVECRTPASIIREHGPPLYVKIDVEHYDQVVLANLFSEGIFPPEVSAESHSIEVFAHLVLGGYNSFSLVEGRTVATKYGNALIRTLAGTRRFAFKRHSAGPFGEDIQAPWEDRETFFHRLAAAGLGWKDIHASRFIPPTPRPTNARLAMRQIGALAGKLLFAIKWRTVDRLARARR